jgi:hydrogenase maturation protease
LFVVRFERPTTNNKPHHRRITAMTERAVMPRILIVGFGNPLMADDGAGPALVAALRSRPLPASVRVEDGGSDATRLAGIWRGEDEVWLVDAVIAGAPAGTVHRRGHDEVLAVAQRHATAHALSLPESLRWLAVAYPEMATVRYRLWGIEAARVALEEGLSPAVARAVAALADELPEALAARLDRNSSKRQNT